MLPALLLAAALITFGTNRACDKNSQTQVRPCGFLRDLIFNGRSLRNRVCGRGRPFTGFLGLKWTSFVAWRRRGKWTRSPLLRHQITPVNLLSIGSYASVCPCHGGSTSAPQLNGGAPSITKHSRAWKVNWTHSVLKGRSSLFHILPEICRIDR